ncbi:hypothetical protein FA10DRAFT_266009 [Acaromyces ingoldii]|uniref:Uncharacterized protein n=1 Tax=Acaromyces ingoldii TaxID=215250 RepID=A0A316YSB9_9BASI|nr:hypothetical protein FA10DRAFT_266009 [Acaromyces ingoldii]PWN92209.1 hypothetical protein FA10DRAFT_266009 [Acaromyces ingoldii]
MPATRATRVSVSLSISERHCLRLHLVCEPGGAGGFGTFFVLVGGVADKDPSALGDVLIRGTQGCRLPEWPQQRWAYLVSSI